MKKEDIAHLATLARIELSQVELQNLEAELSLIVAYVSDVSDIVDEGDTAPAVGARYNIFRSDLVTNDPDEYTSRLLAEMPKTSGRHLVVKKILNTEE